MDLPLKSAPQSICLLRLSAVGDICHTVPVVRRIQHYWPETKITWITGKLESTLVGDIPGIEFIIFDKSQGWSAYRNLRQKLKGRQFDVFLHMQVSLRASLASLSVSANIKLGFDRQRAKDYQWLFTNQKIKAVPRQHVMEGLLEFSNALGVREEKPEWGIPVPDAANEFVNKTLDPQKKWLVISPCSSSRFRNWRNWSAERYAKVADYALEKYNLHTVLTGGPTALEQEYGEKISALSKCKPVNLIGQTSLKQLLAILAKSKVLVSPDSGPAHMATTVNTPVIGLYVTSNPLRTGPYLSQQWLVNKYPQAIEAESGKPIEQVAWGKRVRRAEAMDLITVEDVTGKLDELDRGSFI